MTEQKVSENKTIIGKVISNKMNKTIIVEIERKVKHPLYEKYMRDFSRMRAHDDNNICQIGDIVKIKQSRPLSKTKSWVLVQVIEKADRQNIG